MNAQSDMEDLVNKVSQWHRDRNLIDGSDDKSQTLKLLQELGELSDSVCKEKPILDDIGDMLVVMINLCERNNITLEQCLQVATCRHCSRVMLFLSQRLIITTSISPISSNIGFSLHTESDSSPNSCSSFNVCDLSSEPSIRFLSLCH